MKKRTNCLLRIAALACIAIPAQGHQLSPCLRVLTYDGRELAEAPVNPRNSCRELLRQRNLPFYAVHEHMTVASIREYLGWSIYDSSRWELDYVRDVKEQRWHREPSRFHNTLRIINGTWWNDEPLMRTWGQRSDFGWGALAAAKGVEDLPAYPGSKERCGDKKDYVAPKDHLGRWSHLGEGQHLHFMTGLSPAKSSASDRVDATTSAALHWMAFAYEVATGQRKPTDKLPPAELKRLNLPSVARNHCVKESSVSVRTLFTRTGPGWTDNRRALATPDVALGSMLHVIQDSFSPSHTCRVKKTVGGKPFAVLADVKNYVAQTAGGKEAKLQHQYEDAYPQWLLDYAKSQGKEHTYANDPVSVGAWLIGAVDRRETWTAVEKHLRDTVFAKGLQEGAKCIESDTKHGPPAMVLKERGR